MTEAEATRRWCPFSKTLGHGVSLNRINPESDELSWVLTATRCLAAGCMAWRSTAGQDETVPEGYCGLVGTTEQAPKATYRYSVWD
jgi:hypothetical protein